MAALVILSNNARMSYPDFFLPHEIASQVYRLLLYVHSSVTLDTFIAVHAVIESSRESRRAIS